MSIARNDFFQENGASDSDGVNSYSGDDGDYRPISPLSDSDDDEAVEAVGVHEIPSRINGQDLISQLSEFNSISFQTPASMENHSNGYSSLENGVSSLNLISYDEGEEEEEEEERIRRASELAIAQAFREDESRRTAPLSPENASRIVNAMRGISFPGFPPDWAARVPEDQWMDRLRRSREATASQN